MQYLQTEYESNTSVSEITGFPAHGKNQKLFFLRKELSAMT